MKGPLPAFGSERSTVNRADPTKGKEECCRQHTAKDYRVTPLDLSIAKGACFGVSSRLSTDSISRLGSCSQHQARGWFQAATALEFSTANPDFTQISPEPKPPDRWQATSFRRWVFEDENDLTSPFSALYPHCVVGLFANLGTRVFAAGRRQGSGCKSRAAAQL
jgi:hypothetical protein